MNTKLEKLGVFTRPFGHSVFDEFLPAEHAERAYHAAMTRLESAKSSGVKPETLRVQVSIRSDLGNALQFFIAGPFPRTSQSRFGAMALIYPARTVPLRDGTWGVSHYSGTFSDWFTWEISQ